MSDIDDSALEFIQLMDEAEPDLDQIEMCMGYRIPIGAIQMDRVGEGVG